MQPAPPHSTHSPSPLQPLWKRRPSTSPSLAFPRAHSTLHLNKALPPLPIALQSNDRLPSSSSTPLPSEQSHNLSSLNHEPNPRSASASVLAHAGLELGLTPFLPHPSSVPLSSQSDVFDAPSSPHHSTRTVPFVRKAKSSQKLKSSEPIERTSIAGILNFGRDYRRVRGLSFGSSGLLGSAADPISKGKEKDSNLIKTPPKSLSRKASFWSRKKHPTPTSESSAHSSLASPGLGRSPPVSPGTTSSRSNLKSPSIPLSEEKHGHFRGLSRSLSERAFLSLSSPPIMEAGFSYTSSPRTSQSRPSTAGSSSSVAPQSSNWSRLYPHFLSANSTEFSDTHRPSRSEGRRVRPRAQTNPPLLHRLSFNIFSFATSPPSPNSHEAPGPVDLTSSPSLSKFVNKSDKLPKPHETPVAYVKRLLSSVNKAEVAGILASSAEPFYADCLQIYIDQFDFLDDPLDVAMRKLLMNVGLPRETQQIDRVIESFSQRYLKCNPDLFISEDHPYILAFSLIMLHTDAFNKSNKRKMSKVDYVKNTKLPGVAPEVLEYFYDNIVFAPFIFIEDPLQGYDQHISHTDKTTSWLFPHHTPPATNGVGGTILKGHKIDPYYLIVHNLLSPLRVDVHSYVPSEDPYLYEGTMGPWDIDKLQQEFANANVLAVGGPEDENRDSTQDPSFGLSRDETIERAGCFPYAPAAFDEICLFKVVKIGLLNRKDDYMEGGKKAANRKWRPWSVILTTSHLLFFRDLSLANTFIPRLTPHNQQITISHSAFRPDEWLAISESIAVYDKTYTKYDNTMRFVTSDGRQILLQATQEKELNEWISMINYASAFRTTRMRIRPQAMSGKIVQLTGVAAATSHLHDIQHRSHATSMHNWDSDTRLGLKERLVDERKLNTVKQDQVMTLVVEDGRIPVAPEVDGADQFKATFDQVKADLAASHWISSNNDPSITTDDCRSPPHPTLAPSSLASQSPKVPTGLPSRTLVVQSKVDELQKQIAIIQTQLDVDLRLVRNIARLTPFQKITRDRLQAALRDIAKRVSQFRLDLSKLHCYCDTLSRDLNSEMRSWGEAKKVALRAAKETIMSYTHEKGFPSPSAKLNGLYHPLPTRRISHGSTSSGHTSSSASFHSAIDFGLDSLALRERSFLEPIDDSKFSPAMGRHDKGFIQVSTAADDQTALLGVSASGRRQKLKMSQPILQHVEEAEVWDKTRCAQRVSLVRLPSDLQLGKILHASEGPTIS
ncbi:hypothetical protein AMATHDRAFT_177 [Amanita thiersii Skay4041]|uniref:SEC7 domain-containing protein n=1 Tax=Amanita thiersii Skay4041 TaxID=703135 RepID=A0A2A9P1H9_9AGAR|nr:hypothetical protein AMATHDRAFT_177 [Amanita thiersii Skay4041]